MHQLKEEQESSNKVGRLQLLKIKIFPYCTQGPNNDDVKDKEKVYSLYSW